MKYIYVTGCAGFIGSYVTEYFLKLGWIVRGIDKMTYASDKNVINMFKEEYEGQFTFEEKDINDLDHLYDCDYVINCAAESHVDNSIVSSETFMKSNINGVHRLLELIKSKRNYDMPTLIHFSTDEVYGDIKKGKATEDTILNPSNPYSATKAAADQLILAWHRTYGIPYIILRPTNNYGIGQHIEKLIPKTIKSLSFGKKVPLHEKGKPKRNWLHAYDTARAIEWIIGSNQPYNQIYNINGGLEQSNIDTVKKIAKLVYPDMEDVNKNIKNICDFSYKRDGVDFRYALDDSKLRKLGWKPEVDFDKELPTIVEHYSKYFIW